MYFLIRVAFVLCVFLAFLADANPTDAKFPSQTGCRVPRSQLERVTTRQFSSSDVVIRNQLFANGVQITGKNVVFEDCIFEAAEHSIIQLRNNARAEFRHVTIIGKSYRQGANLRWPSNGIHSSGWTCRWCDISNVCDGAKANGNALMEDSWVHDLKIFIDPEQGMTPSHPDCVQTTHGSNVVLRNNRFDGIRYGPTSSIKLTAAAGGVNGLVVTGNRFYGGGFAVYVNAQNGQACPKNVQFTDNTFVKGSYKYGMFYDRNCKYAASQWARNREIDASSKHTQTTPNTTPSKTTTPSKDPPCASTLSSVKKCVLRCKRRGSSKSCFDQCRIHNCRKAPTQCRHQCYIEVWRGHNQSKRSSVEESQDRSSLTQPQVIAVAAIGAGVALIAIVVGLVVVVSKRRHRNMIQEQHQDISYEPL